MKNKCNVVVAFVVDVIVAIQPYNFHLLHVNFKFQLHRSINFCWKLLICKTTWNKRCHSNKFYTTCEWNKLKMLSSFIINWMCHVKQLETLWSVTSSKCFFFSFISETFSKRLLSWCSSTNEMRDIFCIEKFWNFLEVNRAILVSQFACKLWRFHPLSMLIGFFSIFSIKSKY